MDNKPQLEASDLIIDDCNDCDEGEGECASLDLDLRYDLNQLKILEAVPSSLTYSDVGIMAEDNKDKLRSNVELIKAKGHTNEKHKASVMHQPNKRNVLAPPGQVATLPVSPLLQLKESHSLMQAKKISENENPLIIFHDIYRSQIEWQVFAADIAYQIRRRTIVVDLRNHGTSPFINTKCGLGESIVDVRNLLRELKLSPSKASVIGHKLSGWVLMAYSLLYPYKFKTLVVIEANPDVNPISSKDFNDLTTALNLLQPPRRGLTLRSARFEVGQFLEDFISNSKLRSYVVQTLVVEKIIGKPDKWELRRLDLLESLGSFTKFPDFLRLFTFDKPTLFIASLNSKFIRNEHEVAIKKLFPQAEFVYLTKASSNPHIDEFDNFLKEVTNFLNKHEPAG